MSDLLKPVYTLILDHIQVCQNRMLKVDSAGYFIGSEEREMLFDALNMRLQALGENIKRAVKIDNQLFEKHPEVDWNTIIRFRDFISHHYELLDHEVIFDIGKYHLPVLKVAIEKELSA